MATSGNGESGNRDAADDRGSAVKTRARTDRARGDGERDDAALEELLDALSAAHRGDFSVRLPERRDGLLGDIASRYNQLMDRNAAAVGELQRLGRTVGREGRLTERFSIGAVSGGWEQQAEAINGLIDDLMRPTTEVARVIMAVADGDLSQKMALEIDGQPVRGEFSRIGTAVNTMVDQLSSFAAEVSRVAREVGTDGKLGGQAQVDGVSGIWKDLTNNVNNMASNLTSQVRNIAHVATAVANGDLSQKITVDVKGEILELKDTINTMVDQLSSFADEVTRVAREVGTEGKLGGQADVPGVAGTWKDLTNNVNQLATTLTTQLRAIAEVATAVTQGDLTRSITVEAQGEVADLKDNINQMIANLKETTRKNAEQDWLKTNLAKISQMMQGQRDLGALSRLIMSELTPTVSAQHGAFFLTVEDDEEKPPQLRLIASYGFVERKGIFNHFRFGEGLVGQAAVEKTPILVTDAPADYIRIRSGLGEAAPVNVMVLPVVFEDQVLAVVELASFRAFSDVDRTFLEQVIETIGVVLNTIKATMRTEELLGQSQRLTEELQNQQEELRQANAELQEKARLLAEQNRNIEIKNREIEMARRGLEEKAEQLALSSKYKSEFLANVSHELRTPLNSLLILAQLLEENEAGNLTPDQLEFVTSISDAGRKLLGLINDILDLSKIESGKMEVRSAPVRLRDLTETLEQSFRPVAQQKKVDFEVRLADDLPETIETDEKRLQQILNSLLSNGLKFTDAGQVRIDIFRPGPEFRFATPSLRSAEQVISFAVSDTGVGVPEDKLDDIFEAFQQGDGTANRRFGGTGLGLSISRDIARLLGGEIQVESVVGKGSRFTLHLPTCPKQTNGSAVLDVPHTETPSETPFLIPAGRVLVVSDDPASRDMLRGVLRRAGVIDVTVGPADEAIAHEGTSDVIVVDLEPGGTEPFRLLRRLAESPLADDVIVVTYAQRDLLRTEQAHLDTCGAQLDLRHIRTGEALASNVVMRGHERASDLQNGVVPAPPGSGRLAGRRILVVDDDERNAYALQRVLERHGAATVSADNGHAALDRLTDDGPFDLVLLDIMMPEMDGYETTRAIRGTGEHRGLPIIAVTARAMQGDRELAIAAGATDYIAKPVDIDDLLEVVCRWLRIESTPA